MRGIVIEVLMKTIILQEEIFFLYKLMAVIVMPAFQVSLNKTNTSGAFALFKCCS